MKIQANKPRPHLIEDIAQWPIAKLFEDRESLVSDVRQEAFLNLTTQEDIPLHDLLSKTIYRESIRVKENRWKADLQSEPKFWKKIKSDFLLTEQMDDEDQRTKAQKKILNTILDRYSEEITGGLSIRTVRFARWFLAVFFRRMLNASGILNSINNKKNEELHDRIKVYGNMDKIADLFNEGIVVVLPTHSSNLDSLLIAYSMDQIAGLPSFCYGAGLNLLNSEIVGYFMNRVGIYRIDRRKRNPIYLEALRSFSRISLLRGTNTIFFPGGTRSRSGHLESDLKMGLLNTLIESQKELLSRESKQKIFVVPLIISYNVVLEARSLIHQHLKKGGVDKYISPKDDTTSIRKVLKFAWNYFRQGSEIAMSFGEPLDVFGNKVNKQGISIDKWNRVIDIEEYFHDQKRQIASDAQRDWVYTENLAQRVSREYLRWNVVLSSQVIAYVAYNELYKKMLRLESGDLINLKKWDITVPYDDFKVGVQAVLQELRQMSREKKIQLEPKLEKSFKKVLKKGIKHLGVFHNTKAFVYDPASKTVSTQDHKLLLYYANRLRSYNLDYHQIVADFRRSKYNSKETV